MDLFARLKEMRQQVKEELAHIPRGSSLQNELRMLYWSWRLRSLGKKAESNRTKEEVLKEQIEFLRKEHPQFVPEYDKKFFKL